MRFAPSPVAAGLALAVFSLAADNAVAASPFGDWRFRYMKLRGKKVKVIPGSGITMSLERDDRCRGSSGVNTYFGECVITENRKRIRFPSGLGLTRKGGPPNLLRQENRYLENLQKAKRIQLRGERLKLSSGRKRIELYFRRDTAPSEPLMSGQQINLTNIVILSEPASEGSPLCLGGFRNVTVIEHQPFSPAPLGTHRFS